MNRLNFYYRQQVWDWHLEWESKTIRDAIRKREGDFHGNGIILGLEITGTGAANEIQVATGVAYTGTTTFETAQDPGVDKFSERIFLTSSSKKTFTNILDQQYRVLLKYKETLTGDEEEPIGGGVKRKVKIESSAEVIVTTDVTIPADSILLAIVTGTGPGNSIPSDKIDSSVRVYITRSSHGHTGGIDGPQLTEDGLLDSAVTTDKIDLEALRAKHIPDGEIPLSKLASLVQAKWANENLILNSDFEYIVGTGSLPSFWTKQESASNTIARDTNSLFGKYSIKLTKNATGILRYYTDHLLVKASANYALSGYVKNQYGATKNARVKVSIYSSGDVLLTSYQTTQSNSSTYARHSKTFTTPANASYVIVECFADSAETGVFWFDSIKLEEGSTVTTYLPNLSDSAMREILLNLDAAELSIEDVGELYTAEDIEGALAEIMTAFNAHNTKAAHDALDIDADTLDGIDSTAFILAAGDTMEGNLLFDSGSLLKKKSGVTTYTIIDDNARVWRAVYADLAELLPCKELDVKPGQLFVWNKGKIEKCQNYADPRVIGAYSNTFGFLLGGDNAASPKEAIKKGFIPIAISGRAKVWVIGPVKEGDLLITGSQKGCATKAVSFAPGIVFGKALENVRSGAKKKIDYFVLNR